MELTQLASIILVGAFGFIGWLIKGRFEKVDSLEIRVNTLETKLDVLGDINSTLNTLKTDVEIIKSKLND